MTAPDLSPRQHQIPRDLPIRYAGAARDFNPIHLFAEDAEAAGFDGPVLHGMCVLGWVAMALEGAAGRPLRQLSARFAAPAYVGGTVQVAPTREADRWSATVTDEGGHTLIKQIRSSFLGGVPDPGNLQGCPSRQQRATISASKIRELREAIGHEGPEDAAPPTFAAVVCQRTVFDLLDDPQVALGVHGSIHTAQHLYLATPLQAGQDITVTASVIDDITRRGLRRVVVRSQVQAGHEASGDLLCMADWVLTRRGAGG